MAPGNHTPLLVYSLHTEDRQLLAELDRHLALFARQGILETWHPGLISPGLGRADEFESALSRATVVVLLVSPAYLAEEYVEMERALAARREGRIRVIPILLRPSNWGESPLVTLQVLPRSGRPVVSWSDRDEAWREVTTDLLALLRGSRPAPTLALQAPGGRYDSAWYVHRARAEEDALRAISDSKPVILWGPRRIGKSWLLHHLIQRFREAAPSDARLVQLGLRSFDSECRSSYERFLREIAQRVAASVGREPAGVEAAWQGEGSPGYRLSRVLRAMLQERRAALLLAIDDADVLSDAPFRDDFFHLLRALSDDPDEPWPRLRLLVSASTLRLNSQYRSSPFENLSEPIAVEDLEETEAAELAQRHGLPWSAAECTALRELVGGHPLLSRAFFYEAARHRRPLAELLEHPEEIEAVAQHLVPIREALERDPALTVALRQILAGCKVARRTREYLHQIGLLAHGQGGAPRLRCRLYEELLRETR